MSSSVSSQSVCVSVCLSVFLSVNTYILHIALLVQAKYCPVTYVYLSVCVCVCVSVCLSVSLSVSLLVRQYLNIIYDDCKFR